MPALLDLIAKAQALNLPAGSPAAMVFEEALNALLLAEGPTPRPIDGYSEGLSAAIIDKTTLLAAHAWTTGPWSCLLIDMKADIEAAADDTDDYTLSRNLTLACIELDIQAPPQNARFHVVLDSHHAFIAWTPLPDSEHRITASPQVLADKVLGGLLKGGLIEDIALVGSITITKEKIQPLPFHNLLQARIIAYLEKNPRAAGAAIAEALNLPLPRVYEALQQKDLLALRRQKRHGENDIIRAQVVEHLHANPAAKNRDVAKLFQITTFHVRQIRSHIKAQQLSKLKEELRHLKTTRSTSPRATVTHLT